MRVRLPVSRCDGAAQRVGSAGVTLSGSTRVDSSAGCQWQTGPVDCPLSSARTLSSPA